MKCYIEKEITLLHQPAQYLKIYQSSHLYKRFLKKNRSKVSEIFYFDIKKLYSFKKTLIHFVVCEKNYNFFPFSVQAFQKTVHQTL